MRRYGKVAKVALTLGALGAALHLYQVIHAALRPGGEASEAWALVFLGALLIWSCLP